MQGRAVSLSPPFSTRHGLVEETDVVYPAAIWHGPDLIRLGQDRLAIESFLASELHPRKLNSIHNRLWLAGLPAAPRPLHRQQHILNRTICITERPDEHLVWHEGRIFIKPLPAYLLCHTFWEKYICQDLELFQGACGLLISYSWLIIYESDFSVAQDSRLLPSGISYRDWTVLIGELLDNSKPETMEYINKRYYYGELRLSRLNKIIRFLPNDLWSPRHFVEGFTNLSTWYTAFFEKNFKWMLAVFAFASVLLSALQVGLGTTLLADNSSFERLSYILTLISLIAAFIGIGIVFAFWFFLFCFHGFTIMQYNTSVRRKRNVAKDKA